MRTFEFRGVNGLVAAEILSDDNEEGAGHGYLTDTPFQIAGLANVSCEVDNSSDTHFYDNLPAIVIQSNGNTTVTFECSGLTDDIYAKICGFIYDTNTGAIIEGKRTTKYFAVGYQYEDTDGHTFYRWFYKGMFSIPSYTHGTMNNSTDANGQTITYTAINTAHKFTKAGGEGVKTLAVDTDLNKADVDTFFSTVTTPDALVSKTAYTLTITVGQGAAAPYVRQNGERVYDGASIYAGDQLQIIAGATGDSITVGGVAFTSGDIHIVTGNTTVAVTHSA